MKLHTLILSCAAVLPLLFSAAPASPAAERLGACIVHHATEAERGTLQAYYLATLTESGKTHHAVSAEADASAEVQAISARLIRTDCHKAAQPVASAGAGAASRDAALGLMNAIGKDLVHKAAGAGALEDLSHGPVRAALKDAYRYVAPSAGPRGPYMPAPPTFGP